ncbi:MAG: hypothetical protein J3Q66DRAFT_86993 [Benniella sp.]|nr:MAG: hypothetical protein J3Q66DRAFT_86993 [Benniella sp.]
MSQVDEKEERRGKGVNKHACNKTKRGSPRRQIHNLYHRYRPPTVTHRLVNSACLLIGPIPGKAPYPLPPSLFQGSEKGSSGYVLRSALKDDLHGSYGMKFRHMIIYSRQGARSTIYRSNTPEFAIQRKPLCIYQVEVTRCDRLLPPSHPFSPQSPLSLHTPQYPFSVLSSRIVYRLLLSLPLNETLYFSDTRITPSFLLRYTPIRSRRRSLCFLKVV